MRVRSPPRQRPESSQPSLHETQGGSERNPGKSQVLQAGTMPEMRSMGAEMDTEGSHVGASGPHNRRSTWPTTIAIALWFLMMLPVAGLLPDLTVNGEPVSLPGTILL